MPYIDTTMDEFLEIATESIVGNRKNKSVSDLLSKAEKKLTRKLKTTADCDDYLAGIKSESTKFNECLSTLKAAKKKYDSGKITPRDFDETTKAAVKLLSKNCKMLQCKLGNFVDDKRAITEADIKAFKSYVTGLNSIVMKIRKNLKVQAQMESASMDFFDDYVDDIYIDDPALEAADKDDKDDDDDKDDEDEDDKKPKKKKSTKKKDDDDDDDSDSDDKDKDDEDDKDKDDKDDKDDGGDLDLGLDDFSVDEDTDDDDDDSDDDEDDDKDDKKSKKSTKKKSTKKKDDKDDDDEDDKDDKDDDDDAAKESAFMFYDDDLDELY